MKKEKALEYSDKFPDVSEELFCQARRIHKPFVLFNHSNRAYCTHCEREYKIAHGELKHKAKCFCSQCKVAAQAIDITKNYKGNKVSDIANATIFLAGTDGNLYARCFSQRMGFKHVNLRPVRDIIETQRYVFTPAGAARFGITWSWYEDGRQWYRCFNESIWDLRTKFSSPNFLDTSMGYRVYHAYDEINLENALENTWMKNCAVGELDNNFSVLHYLNFYIRHQGAERLIKCGFSKDVENMIFDNDFAKRVNWKQTEVPKMLGVNRAELRYIRKEKVRLDVVLSARKIFPELSLEKAIEYFDAFGGNIKIITRVLNIIGRHNASKLVKYIRKQKSRLEIYKDYIENSRDLGYDLNSREILFPPRLGDAHDRVDSAMEARRLEERLKAEKANKAKIEKIKKSRKKFEFEYGNYFIRLPEDAEEIIAEGKALRHCVGGYAERHLLGKTTIMFLRRKSAPDAPYFTIEVDNDLEIVQCHGYRNECENDKPEDIIELEKIYSNYLYELKYGKTQIKIGA